MLSPFSRIFNQKNSTPNSPPPGSGTGSCQSTISPCQDLLVSSSKVDPAMKQLQLPPAKSLPGYFENFGVDVMAATTNGGNGGMLSDLQDLSSAHPATNQGGHPEAGLPPVTVSADEATNALVNDKGDVAYLGVPHHTEEDGAGSSFLSYLPDQGANGTDVNAFSNAASQLAAAAYPYIYEVGNTYTPLANSSITSALVNAQQNGHPTLQASVSPVPNGQPAAMASGGQQQVVSYNGETYLIQSNANGTHQLIANLNTAPRGASPPPAQNLQTLDKPFNSPESPGNDNNNTGQGLRTSSVQSYITRVSPTTIQWLIQNYETAEGVSLPRSTLYNHYQRHCTETKQEPVNAASFGKLIRSVFLGLRTRRIGTRGNSKYHYYGIRVKPTSILNNISEDSPPPVTPCQQNQAQQNSTTYGINPTATKTVVQHQVVAKKRNSTGQALPVNHNNNVNKPNGPEGAAPDNGPAPPGLALGTQLKQYLGKNGDAKSIPDFPKLELNTEDLPEECDENASKDFEECYKKHCIEILETVTELNLPRVEQLWTTFWQEDLFNGTDIKSDEDNQSGSNKENLVDDNSTKAAVKDEKADPKSGTGGDQDGSDTSTNSGPQASKKRPKMTNLSAEEICSLWTLPVVQNFILEADYALYQHLINILIPQVLKPIPNSLTQGIRGFAKSLELWMTAALTNVPDEIKALKVNAVKCLAQCLRRYTGLNHLAQAARAVLQNTTQITQMLSDLNKVDFNNVQDQASWVCQCDAGTVSLLESEFKATLAKAADLDTWADWLQQVVNKVLPSVKEKSEFPKAARQFLLKWSFYSSMVIRDLTLRSAASFGSFHLIRLLYDEYMFYLVEQKVASVLEQSPVAVMGLGQFRTANASMISHIDDSGPSERKVAKPNGVPEEKPLVNGETATQ